MPESTLLYFHDGCDFVLNKFEFGSWALPSLGFPPGRGALIYNGGEPFEAVFSGDLPAGDTPLTLNPGWNLIALVASSVEALAPVEDDRLLRFVTGAGVVWHEYVFGAWEPELNLAPGEAFFYSRGPLPANCPDAGQVAVYFDNRVKAWGLDAPVMGADWVTPLADPHWRVRLYAGSVREELTPIGAPIPFREEPGAGYVRTSADSVIRVPGIAPGTSFYVQMRGWDSRLGGSYEEATAVGGFSGTFDWAAISVRGISLAPGLELPTVLEGLSPLGPPLSPVYKLTLERKAEELALVVTVIGPPAPFVVEVTEDLVRWTEWGGVAEPVSEASFPLPKERGARQFFRCRLRG